MTAVRFTSTLQKFLPISTANHIHYALRKAGASAMSQSGPLGVPPLLLEYVTPCMLTSFTLPRMTSECRSSCSRTSLSDSRTHHQSSASPPWTFMSLSFDEPPSVTRTSNLNLSLAIRAHRS